MSSLEFIHVYVDDVVIIADVPKASVHLRNVDCETAYITLIN